MMNERQAQELAQAIKLKSRAWMDDDLYGAFLRNEIFGGLHQEVSIVRAEKGDGFAVRAHWEHLDETFYGVEEWLEFVAKIDERMGFAALSYQDDIERREWVNL